MSDGIHRVGPDIEPGTYRTAGPANGLEACYFARLSGLSGEVEDIAANGNPSGPAVVRIRKSDVAFETQGCRSWKPVTR